MVKYLTENFNLDKPLPTPPLPIPYAGNCRCTPLAHPLGSTSVKSLTSTYTYIMFIMRGLQVVKPWWRVIREEQTRGESQVQIMKGQGG